jgi:hypothetical protein
MWSSASPGQQLISFFETSNSESLDRFCRLVDALQLLNSLELEYY